MRNLVLMLALTIGCNRPVETKVASPAGPAFCFNAVAKFPDGRYYTATGCAAARWPCERMRHLAIFWATAADIRAVGPCEVR